MLNILKKIIASLKSLDKSHLLIIKEIQQDEKGSFLAVIQLPGRPVFFKNKIQDIVADESLLTQFPPEQIKTLVTLACNEKYHIHPYKISAFDFETSSFIIREHETGKYISLSMDQLNEPYLLEQFSHEDVFKIGVMYGEQKVQAELDEIRKIRQPELNVVCSI